MSEYDDFELSADDGQPVELYEFVGTYKTYYYTSAAENHTLLSKVYLPVAGLKRSTIKAMTSDDSDNSDVTLDFPINNQLIKDYGFQTTPPSLFLTIYRYHRGGTEARPYWRGPVTSIALAGVRARVRVPSRFGYILQGNIPNVYYQPPCNNVLFDERCKVNRGANTVNTTVQSVSGRVIVVQDIGLFPSGWFRGGELIVPATNERRSIVVQDTVDLRKLTVNYGFGRLSPGTVVQVASGCDHSFLSADGCLKYNNQSNYGGDPFIPGENNNPFTKGLD